MCLGIPPSSGSQKHAGTGIFILQPRISYPVWLPTSRFRNHFLAKKGQDATSSLTLNYLLLGALGVPPAWHQLDWDCSRTLGSQRTNGSLMSKQVIFCDRHLTLVCHNPTYTLRKVCCLFRFYFLRRGIPK